MDTDNKANILGAYVDIIDPRQAIQKIKLLVEQEKPAHVITLNAEIVYQGRNDSELLEVINHADLVTPDGIGIVWAGQKLGYHITERVTGIDLLYQICEKAAKESWKVYLLGAAPGVAEAAGKRLVLRYPGLKVCGCNDGYFSAEATDEVIQQIKELQPEILFVALGAPKQEFWIREYKNKLGVPVSIGVGGSFDVVAGMKDRAPAWMIEANLEWLYRLIKEPSRFRRQLALPKFMIQVLKQKRGKNR